ncbi:MAG TPA: aminotransferase class V-fold PLP-dependent enzyme [Rhodothermales bacterium]|nr:aminotransferase class V-fold PLP-dependent enzyme [Rhodothermales bacterium]
MRPAVPRPTWPPVGNSDPEEFWQLVRAQYPLTRERVYFNTGGLGPAPYPVLDVLHRTTLELQAISEHGHQQFEEARETVAAFLGAKPSEIAFTRNATEGNSTVASGLQTMGPGDEVIFESHAHPGGSEAWLSRQKQQGIKVKIFEPDPTSAVGNLERIAALITPRTRVIQVSHITAPTGIRFPVEDIARLAHDRNIWFHIDGAQSAGMIPVDLRAIGCDSYATSCHKWMGASHGTGVLFVREERLDEVAPTEVGAYSDDGYHLPDSLTYNPTAQRYEPGTRDAAQVLGIVAAARFMDDIGMERVAAYGQSLARHLQDALLQIPGVTVLTPRDPALSASITTYKTDRVPYDKLFSYLMSEHKMRCRVVTERGLDALRVSTHIFNSMEECDQLVEGTKEVLSKA